MFDAVKEKAILKDALRLYAQKQLEALPSDETVEQVTFSVSFERKMQKLIKAQRRATWKYLNTAGKKAVAILVAALLAATTAMAVPQIREPIIKAFVKTFSDHTNYEVNSDTLATVSEVVPETIETVYLPTAIPEGFVEIMNEVTEVNTMGVWDNGSGDTIIFMQDIITVRKSLNTEGTTITETTINGLPGHTYTNNGITSYLWSEHGYALELMVPESFTPEQDNAIISSIKPVEK